MEKTRDPSAYNAGDPCLIPGWGRSAGEGIGYLLQYSWASLVAQLVKDPPAMWETWIRSLSWEDPLEKGMVTHSSILAWRIPWAVWSMGHKEWDTTVVTFSFLSFLWRGKCVPTPVFLPGKSHEQRGLTDYSPWGCRELDMTERLTLSLQRYQ